jgi:DNA repair protein RecN (Recombination protein N)
MVFDEIDTGISGRIARTVGEVMKDLSRTHQVLCITHLPQIASLADRMIRVMKSETGSTSLVTAQEITGEDVVVEIAKLLSGATISDAALDGARELMTTPQRKRTR